MKRLLEPELMNDLHQVKAYSEANFDDSDNQLISCLKKYIKDKSPNLEYPKTILDIGCGPGNITEKLAKVWPDSHIIGIDGSNLMIEEAIRRKRISSCNFKNIQYICCDISDFKNLKEIMNSRLNLVVSNSLLHHIHDPYLFWKTLKFICPPGVINFHRDLRRPISNQEVMALLQKYLAKAPEVLKRDYKASLRAAFTVKEISLQLHQEELTKLKVYEIQDRYLEIVGTI